MEITSYYSLQAVSSFMYSDKKLRWIKVTLNGIEDQVGRYSSFNSSKKGKKNSYREMKEYGG